MIQGILFDMDGLMFDTERIGLQGWLEAGRQLNIPVTEELVAQFRGTGISQCREIFNSRIPGELYDRARKIRHDFADIYIRKNGLPVKPGLYELLNWLRDRKIPAALATSTGREKTLGYLEEAGVKAHFSALVFGTEVPNPKPAPDIFLAAAEQLRAEPGKCVVLEDSFNGLCAAKAAGCFAVVVPDLTPAPPENAHLWDAKADTLTDVIPILEMLRR